MAVRIHFTDDDLAHIRLAQAPEPMWEALLSMHMLQTDTGSAVFGGWRHRVRRELPADVRPLLRLAPPVDCSADFLTPAAGTGGLDAGTGALLSTPRQRLRGDLLELARAGRRLPRWARPLADGDKEAVAHLARVFRQYFGTALAPVVGPASAPASTPNMPSTDGTWRTATSARCSAPSTPISSGGGRCWR
ncbi:hypothetical protein [Streptomyces sp. GESEQ-35]|uniref:hypothetical protein n=1 Tax=Streptomyces sp. GESEQ-35 TaxID=2812657 RepID=UPI001B318B99|nr:hypothetical protein [Streptomyces sp. GESEQ-35]